MRAGLVVLAGRSRRGLLRDVRVELVGLAQHLLVLGALFVAYALRLKKQATTASAMRVFAFSIAYLFLLFAMMVVDQVARSLTGMSL